MNRRAPMIAGLVFAVLYASAVLVIPAIARSDDDAAARVQALLLAFSTLGLVVALTFARDRLSGPSAHLFTIGSAVLVAQLCVAIWFTSGPALRPGQLATSTARVIGDVGSLWLPSATIANILVAVPILVAANDDRLPRWLGTAAAVFTVEQLLETITIIGPPGSFISPGGPMNHYLGGTLTVGFYVALGVALSWSDAPSLSDAPPLSEAPSRGESPSRSGRTGDDAVRVEEPATD